MNDHYAQALIDRYLAGELTEEDRIDLERLLLASHEARTFFWQICGTHAALQEWGRAHWGRVAAVEPAHSPASRRIAGGITRWIGPPRSTSAGWIMAGCLAAVLVAVSLIYVRSRGQMPDAAVVGPPSSLSPETKPSATSVAWVEDSSDAVWDEPMRLAVGDQVSAGPLRLRAGIVQLRFASGATVALNGPVDLEIVNEKRIFLRGGSITPFVPPRAHGFTVVSPSGEVVDLGTEFSIGVDADGRTSVYVIDGEVDVSSGHARRGRPLRMTQGFAAGLASPADAAPSLAQVPIVIDHFDGERPGGADDTRAPLRWIDIDPRKPARLVEGSLMIPIDNEITPDDPAARILIDQDCSRLVGRRSTIAFKATLPEVGSASFRRWLAFVIDSGGSPEAVPRVPLAQSTDAAAAVMVSPEWQASLRIRGQPVRTPRIFQRDEEAVGPYQVLITIDDSPEGRQRDGGATISLMVNGGEVVTRQRFDLGESPRLGFHTFLPIGRAGKPKPSGRGGAFIDDFSISIDVTADATSARPISAE